MNQPWVYTCSHPEPPSYLPPHPIPQGHPSAPARSALSQCIKPGLVIYFTYMIIYMFQCYSLKSSHHCLLQQSPKVCFLHLCLFCCLAHRVIIIIFLQTHYKQCCDEHWGTCVSFSSGFLGVYVQHWDCWVIWQFYFQFFKESSHCSP